VEALLRSRRWLLLDRGLPGRSITFTLRRPGHQLEEFAQKARRADCSHGVFLEWARLVFIAQQRDRIAKLDMTGSYDTAKGQHVKGLPFCLVPSIYDRS
jgi:hypothetical protein